MNRFYRRYISFVLAVIVLVFTLAGCGKILDLGYNSGESEKADKQIQDPENPKSGEVTTDNSSEESSKDTSWAGDLVMFQYHPGYSDMNGGHHYETLGKRDGEWIIECCDQEELGEPEITTIYSVSEEDVQAFGDFLKEKHVDKLMNREDSDDFVTDYSAWSYSISFVDPTGQSKYIEVRFDQYKEYSDKDYKLIEEIYQRFESLKTNMVSQTEEYDN
jgi:hypothetical protein